MPLHSLCLWALLLVLSYPPQDSEYLLRRGISFMNSSRPADAEGIFRSILQQDPNHESARTLLGYLLLQRSALDEAESAFTAVLDRNPKSAPARFGLGMAMARKGMARGASREFERVLDDPAVGRKARVQWIETLFLQGREDDALKEAREALWRYPTSPEYHRMAGVLYQARGEHKEALRLFERAVELDPADLRNYLTLIELNRIQRNFEAALQWAERALDIDANSPLIYEEQSVLLKRLGKDDDARTAKDEAGKTLEAELTFTRAAKALASGHIAEAKDLLERTVALNPRLTKAWIELGEIQRDLANPDGAYHSFLMAVETDPENARARLGMALVLQAQGKGTEALASLNRAVNRGMNTPDLLAGMAGAYTDEGKTREAAAVMLRALRELPDDPDLVSYLGYLHESGGNPRDAMDAYSEALKINPRQTDALLGKGRNLLAGGDAQGAIEMFRTVLDSDAGNLQAWYGLIQASRQSRNNAAAETACHSCLKQNSGDPYCREQLAFLRMEASDYCQAGEHLQALLRSGAASKSILDGLAFSLMKTGDLAQAIGLFESSLERYGKDERIYSTLGYLYRCRNNLPSSIAAYRRARDMAPDSPERNHDLGFVLYLARQYEAAVSPFHTALRVRPDWGEAHYNLAMNHWQLGQHALALTHARLAQEKGVDKAGPVVRALTRHLKLGTPKAVSANRSPR